MLGALAFRVPKTRKAVGILWDLGSFWPRDVHPLAPPCYAERAVPELAMRLDEHAAMVTTTGPAPETRTAGTVDEAPTPGLVVLASHSQGTVISMAALLGPAWRSADHTVLLTFGTVLRRLYARFFPLYFSSRRLCRTRANGWVSRRRVPTRRAGTWGRAATRDWLRRVLRWRNLWRRTDYLGGRLGDPLADAAPTAGSARDGVDRRGVRRSGVPARTRRQHCMPAAGRHSNFPRDPAFQGELMRLLRTSFASLDPASAAEIPVGEAPPGATDELMNPRESMA